MNRLAPDLGSALLGIAVLAASAAAADSPSELPPAASRPVDYTTDVEPLLAARCYECHGPERQRATLRLDVKDAALKGGRSGEALQPGNSAGSLLIRKVAGLEGKRMPPTGEPLSAEQIGLLRAWIDQGARFTDRAPDTTRTRLDHWSYRQPERPAVPSVADPAWGRNPIDAFVRERLDREQLRPAAAADRATWLRRVSLDLTGLPPALAEVDAFVNDASEDADARVVDRLLASPHYGERWARWWLDLARYADTHGYEKDPRRTMWRYRDWVIDAFNRDLPFDQFTIEQLAGDLLPAPALEQRIATGFHRNTMINEEGGVDQEEYRCEAVLDRVNTTAAVWLGATLGCAQCHDHKYDPFSQREYYQMFAFFNGDDDVTIEAPTPAQLAERERLQAELAALEQTLHASSAELQAAQLEWEARMQGPAPAWTALDPASMMSAGGAALIELPDHSILASGENPRNDTLTIVAHAEATTCTGLRLEVLPDASLPSSGPGRHENGSFVISSVLVTLAPKGRPAEAKPVRLSAARADYTQQGHSASSLIDGVPGPGWAADAYREGYHVRRAVAFATAEPIPLAAPATFTITIKNDSQWPHANVGRLRWSITGASDPLGDVPDPIRAIIATPPLERASEQRQQLAEYFRSITPLLDATRAEVQRRRAALPAFPTALVLQRRQEPRATYVHRRGNFLNRGDQVAPQVPAVWPQIEDGTAKDRLALARWLVAADNPLTARVLVNRVWEQFFGRGIVVTSEDFGSQGEPPSHPELLDWLATELVRDHWSLKQLCRRIATSATYRQGSSLAAELRERDPANQWLARGPRHRVEAEGVRDIALAASGLLCERVGGPSVFPPQPDGIWTMIYSDDKWVNSEGEDRYRRGLYTFWRRTAPYPSFVAFDAPSREACCTRRPRTNTPLQALVTLNDPAFVEAAIALARRMVAPGDATPEARAALGYRLCVARCPSAVQLRELVQLHAHELARYRQSPEDALTLLNSVPLARAAGEDACEVAAWSLVANVLLNMDATLTKE
ncbi:MAG: PSD1 and planctomycete cytochrome C domain-containing protein [Planctomycetota bacterium]